jgi:two-component system, NtrC family, nitrogen regulation sensor histidine kinase NtrY
VRRARRPLPHDVHVLLLALLAGLPGAVVALVLLWGGAHSPKVQWTLTVLVCGVWWGAAAAVRGRVVRPLQTVSNLLLPLREGDYSVRGRWGRPEDALGEVMHEVNLLAGTLRAQRLGALEADALLTHVIEEIDVSVLTLSIGDIEALLGAVRRWGGRARRRRGRLEGRVERRAGVVRPDVRAHASRGARLQGRGPVGCREGRRG